MAGFRVGVIRDTWRPGPSELGLHMPLGGRWGGGLGFFLNSAPPAYSVSGIELGRCSRSARDGSAVLARSGVLRKWFLAFREDGKWVAPRREGGKQIR